MVGRSTEQWKYWAKILLQGRSNFVNSPSLLNVQPLPWTPAYETRRWNLPTYPGFPWLDEKCWTSLWRSLIYSSHPHLEISTHCYFSLWHVATIFHSILKQQAEKSTRLQMWREKCVYPSLQNWIGSLGGTAYVKILPVSLILPHINPILWGFYMTILCL